MPRLVDTTIRLMSQEPLAGRMPTADLLRLAEILDGAGFAYLEVSGGGAFDTAVRRGVESPWERIRALKARTKTPLAMALRGRFLVGSHPVGGDFARRFVASAADSGIDVFRLHDPLHDGMNPRESVAQALAGMGFETGIDVDVLWEASDLVDEFIGDEPVTPLAPRVAVRAAQYAIPAGLVAAIDSNLRAHAAGDRMDEVLEELRKIRTEVGSPPLASPIGQILGSQALIHVLGASRYSTVIDEVRDLVLGRFGTPPGEVDPGVKRAVELLGGPGEDEPLDLEELREEANGLASSEEELLLLALFGDEAIPLLKAIRNRSSREETLLAGEVDRARAERIRELVRIVQETGVGEITIEEEGMRVSVRRTEERGSAQAASVVAGEEQPAPAVTAPRDDVIRVESPMGGP